MTEGSTSTVGKSPTDAALDRGEATVAGQTRKVVKARRTTDSGQRELQKQEALRKKDSDLFQASLKKKKANERRQAAAVEGSEDESDWESVEEDFPHVKLSELLDGLTLEVNNGGGDDDDDIDESAKVSFAPASDAQQEEEKKQ